MKQFFGREDALKLQLLCASAGINCPTLAEEIEIEGIAMDSRRVVPGGMFICIRGIHADGHAYISRAIAMGAVCILTDCKVETNVPDTVVHLTADNTRCAAAYLFDAWNGFPSKRLRIIGVTGTNGKTSVTHMLKAIFESALCRCGVIGTVGCESVGRPLVKRAKNELFNMTTPDPPELYRVLAEMAEDGVEYVFMEVTSHALALDKVAPLSFEAAIFTNLTPEHLDFHGSMEAYADAKATLFTKSKLSIINRDSTYAPQMTERAAGKILTCSVSCYADYTAENCVCNENGIAYDLCSGSSRIRITCPITGRFTVANSMQAAICGLQMGVSVKNVKNALASLSGVKGRMERVRLGMGADFSVFIDYAHTPDALEKLLCTAKDLKRDGGRIVLLFGCGGDRDKSKRSVMGRLASHYADYTVVTSDNSRSEEPEAIIKDILRGIDKKHPHTVIVDRKQAIEYVVQTAKSRDVILLAGKGHEEYEITRTERLPFCEKEIVRKAFEVRRRTEQNTDAMENDK